MMVVEIAVYVVLVAVTYDAYLDAWHFFRHRARVVAQRRREAARAAEWEARRPEREAQEAAQLKVRQEAYQSQIDWLKAHPPELYWNTVDGITIVVTPQQYLANLEETQNAREDGLWDVKGINVPIREGVAYFSKDARERIWTGLNIDPILIHYCAGWPSDLKILKNDYCVELIKRTDLFVPWVNEKFLTFQEQANRFSPCKDRGRYEYLILPQVPAEYVIGRRAQ